MTPDAPDTAPSRPLPDAGVRDLPATIGHIITAACRAPSVHNSQPWRWRAGPEQVELRADRSRRLGVTDPDGRNLTLSCGAALQHLQEAAGALGYATDVARMPDPREPDLLARVRFTPAPIPLDAATRLAAIADRCTDRRRFTSWPIPVDRLQRLAATSGGPDTSVIALTEVGTCLRAELLVNRALELQRRDPRVADEVAHWLGDVAPEDPELRSSDVEGTDGLIVIATSTDDPLAWLRAGEALSTLWLRAAASGLSVVPLSQVVEVAETRAAMMHDIVGERGHPQLLVRIGWQEIGRATLPRTPRRLLGEVVDA